MYVKKICTCKLYNLNLYSNSMDQSYGGPLVACPNTAIDSTDSDIYKTQTLGNNVSILHKNSMNSCRHWHMFRYKS